MVGNDILFTRLGRVQIIEKLSEIFPFSRDVISDIFDDIFIDIIEDLEQKRNQDLTDVDLKFSEYLDLMIETLCFMSYTDDYSKKSDSYLDICERFKNYRVFLKKSLNMLSSSLEGDNNVKSSTSKSFSKILIPKYPWDLKKIENLYVKENFDILKLFLLNVQNYSGFYRVKESKDKIWPPSGPGNECYSITIREVGIDKGNSTRSEEDNQLLKDMENNIKDLIIRRQDKKFELNSILARSQIKEYNIMKIEDNRKIIDNINTKIVETRLEYCSTLFNNRNKSFIDYICDNQAETSKNNMVFMDLHGYNRDESVNIICLCIALILKYKLDVNISEYINNNNNGYNKVENKELKVQCEICKSMSHRNLIMSSDLFRNYSFIDLYICVGMGNHINNRPKLASLVRRISSALHLPWRFATKGVVILRILKHFSWFDIIKTCV
ncbi:uncharacterized protein CMU_025240 [Cryptosporidium muris RN66]|uniref:Uncharacterized protein n=1 Tax=Cryptosporidium muris (strain RN66) TaxID=441375 RepID=B6AAW6_CRYMR|nr:uncharacterized protein CMU_025240 [Cryptosporidium muris RN66]EEA05518.1 hypothetical protein, conserved [Cryptosporidium muris RN66]|eukprot:XP_002139867.1 hypothetical protein [Cryptosporidium muris RN66]